MDRLLTLPLNIYIYIYIYMYLYGYRMGNVIPFSYSLSGYEREKKLNNLINSSVFISYFLLVGV